MGLWQVIITCVYERDQEEKNHDRMSSSRSGSSNRVTRDGKTDEWIHQRKALCIGQRRLEACAAGAHKTPRSSSRCSGVSNSIPRSSASWTASGGDNGSEASAQKLPNHI